MTPPRLETFCWRLWHQVENTVLSCLRGFFSSDSYCRAWWREATCQGGSVVDGEFLGGDLRGQNVGQDARPCWPTGKCQSAFLFCRRPFGAVIAVKQMAQRGQWASAPDKRADALGLCGVQVKVNRGVTLRVLLPIWAARVWCQLHHASATTGACRRRIICSKTMPTFCIIGWRQLFANMIVLAAPD